MILAAFFHLYLFFCPAAVEKPTAQCFTEHRPCGDFAECVKALGEARNLYSPGKRLVSGHIREGKR